MANLYDKIENAHLKLSESIKSGEKINESKKEYAKQISELFFENVNTTKINDSEKTKLKSKLTELMEAKIGKMIEDGTDIPLFIDETEIRKLITDSKKSEDLVEKLDKLKPSKNTKEIEEKRKIVKEHYDKIEKKNEELRNKDKEITSLKEQLADKNKLNDIVVVKGFQTIKHKRTLKKIEKIQKLKDEYRKINTPTKEQKLEHLKQVIAIVLNSFSFKEGGIVRSGFRRLINAFKKKDFDSIYNDLKPIMEWLDKTAETEKNSNIKKLKTILYNEIIDNYESFKTTINDETKFEKKK